MKIKFTNGIEEIEVETESPIPRKGDMVVINSRILGRVDDATYYYENNKETKVTVFLWRAE